MANVSTGFSIGIVKLSKGQAIVKNMLVEGMVFHGIAATTSCSILQQGGSEVWRAVGYNPSIWFNSPRPFTKLTVATTLAAGVNAYVYLA